MSALDNDLLNDDTTASTVDEPMAAEEAVNPEDMTFSSVIHMELSVGGHEDYGTDRQSWWADGDVNRGDVTYDDLQQIYDEGSMALQQVFPTFDDYVEYMVEREAIIQSDPYYQMRSSFEQQASHKGMYLELMQRDPNTLNEVEQQVLAEYQAHIDSGQPLLTFQDENSTIGQVMGEGFQALWEQSMSEGPMAELNASYGIDPNGTWTNDDGDSFQWTGSGMVKTNKIDDHNWDKLAFGLAVGLAMGPIGASLGSALTGVAGMSSGMASAAGKAIASSMAQLIQNGEVDPTQALTAAVSGYFAENGISGTLEDLGVNVGELTEGVFGPVQEQLTNFQQLVSTGVPIVDAAVQAGGVNMLTQLVLTGEVDVASAASAALQAGGAVAVQQFINSVDFPQEQKDEFAAWLEQDDELQQAFIDGDVKDPFLNPNYTTIGDGLMQNSNGDVYNYEGERIGNMSDLDVDGDGKLNINDLEFVESTGEYKPIEDLTTPPGYTGEETAALNLRDGGTYYVDGEGNVFTADQVDYRDDGVYVVKGTDIETQMAEYSESSDIFYTRDDNGNLEIVLRGDDAGIINSNTGNELEYGDGNSDTGNVIFDDISGTPGDLGDAQYSGTIYKVDGEYDVYYDPNTNKTYLVNKSDPTEVTMVPDDQVEEVMDQVEDNATDTTGGGSITDGSGSNNGDPSDSGGATAPPTPQEIASVAAQTGMTVEQVAAAVQSGMTLEQILQAATTTPIGDVDESVDNPLTEDNTTDSTDDSTDDITDNDQTDETVDEVTDGGEVESGGGDGGAGSNPNPNANPLVNKVTGLLSGMQDAASDALGGNGGDGSDVADENTDKDGNDDNDSTDSGGNETDEPGGPGKGGGPGGPGDPGGLPGGGGGMLAAAAGGDFEPKWGELFAYTNITPQQAQALKPLYKPILKAKGMLS